MKAMLTAADSDTQVLQDIQRSIPVLVTHAIQTGALITGASFFSFFIIIIGVPIGIEMAKRPLQALSTRYVQGYPRHLGLRGIHVATDPNAEYAGFVLVGCIETPVWANSQRDPRTLGLQGNLIDVLDLEALSDELDFRGLFLDPLTEQGAKPDRNSC